MSKLLAFYDDVKNAISRHTGIYLGTDQLVCELADTMKFTALAGGGKQQLIVDNDGNLLANTFLAVVAKSANDNVVSATFGNDTHLLFTIGANETWVFETQIFIHQNNTAPANLYYKLTVPSGASATGNALWAYNLVTNVYSDDDLAGTPTNALTSERTLVNVNYGTNAYAIVNIKGIVVNSSTAGDVQLQWRKDAGSISGFTVLANSYLKATKIL